MVTSTQRYAITSSECADEVASEYFNWLSTAWGPLVQVRISAQAIIIQLLRQPAIRMKAIATHQSIVGFEIVGGFLARPGGRMTFSRSGDAVQVNLEEFKPRLPLWIYRFTHGPVHEWTMARFGRHLQKRNAP